MEEENPVRKFTLLKPEGSRRLGRPKLRWIDGRNRGRPEEAWNQDMEKTGVGQGRLEESFDSG
ncbi:hypothetical protein C0J52_26173 [Blattella germanica]|nr:hypothetical protein C0J52_26173 [Blattella germanica]